VSLCKITDLPRGLVKCCTKIILDRKRDWTSKVEKYSEEMTKSERMWRARRRNMWNWERSMRSRNSAMGKEEKEKHRVREGRRRGSMGSGTDE